MTEDEATKAAFMLFLFARPDRMLLLERLLVGEATVGELAAAGGIAESYTSVTLGRMKVAGLLDYRREQQMRFYKVADRRLSFVRNLLDVSYAVEKPSAIKKRSYVSQSDPKPRG
jgi:DNA-binding transcriptional ArsR family regulator